jgi:hypothetical protein
LQQFTLCVQLDKKSDQYVRESRVVKVILFGHFLEGKRTNKVFLDSVGCDAGNGCHVSSFWLFVYKNQALQKVSLDGEQ